MYDAIIVGAGIGGLTCATRLAKEEKKVLIVEKIHHIGGTSHIFKRKGFSFPMGPLSFSFPQVVLEILKKIGVNEKIEFIRNHFQLIAPGLDIIYSQPLDQLKNVLKKYFTSESQGIDKFFIEMEEIMRNIEEIYKWHPDFLIGKKKRIIKENINLDLLKRIEKYENYSKTFCIEILDKYLSNFIIKNFLGSQSTYKPQMSLSHLAFMWDVMSKTGIWFPFCGIHGLNELIHKTFLNYDGEIKLLTPVKEILIQNNRAIGIKTLKDEIYRANWIISNADYKTTFIQLINQKNIPKNFLSVIKNCSYTGSELCIYLGVDSQKVDLSKMRATHLFYRKEMKSSNHFNPEDFNNREIEICLWSNNLSDLTPTGKTAILLRVNFPYDHFTDWRISEKKRKEGYKEYKQHLARKLINTVENILPGLNSSIEVMEIATPLTYQDWGQRYHGSVAGWTRKIEETKKLPGKLLLITPIENLLMIGIYASSELFLGGFPTSMYTSNLAAEFILESQK
jgi:all-trans-retinol 13,14-reductase